MRPFESFKPLLGLFFLAILISGCQEEELITGKLKVTFTNNPSDLVVYISPAENSQISISGPLRTNSTRTLTYDLNYGNYILTSSSATYFPQVGFQIIAGETTTIYFDSDNIGHIQ